MVHVLAEKQKSKLDKRSISCIFVGYPNDSKGYQLFNPDTRKMIRSNDVLFFEKKISLVIGNPNKQDIVDEHCQFYFEANDDETTDTAPEIVPEVAPNPAV